MTTLYYDPVVDVHHRLPVSLALTTSYYAAPQVPEDARRLFEAGCSSVGLDGPLELPLRAARGYLSSLALAREWEIDDLDQRLAAAIEASYEPTWDTERGEFTWGLGLGEEHPRGQFNALLAAAEAMGPGLWTRLSAAPLPATPQVVGVDFPAMALRRAEWRGETLYLALAPLHADPRATTSFRVLVDDGLWTAVGLDGARVDPDTGGVVVTVPRVEGDIELRRAPPE